jgi:hypothetical protein
MMLKVMIALGTHCGLDVAAMMPASSTEQEQERKDERQPEYNRGTAEGQPRNNRATERNQPQPPTGHAGAQPRAMRGHPADRSANLDFAKVCKESFRYTQVSHHFGNWKSLPKGIAASLNRFVGMIRPPSPSEELANELAALAVDFGQKICRSVQDHLKRVKTKTEQTLITLDGTDKLEARAIVERQLTRKLGKKLPTEHRTSLLTEAFDMVGLSKSTSGANRPVQISQNGNQPGPSKNASKMSFSTVVSDAVTPRTKRARADADNSSDRITKQRQLSASATGSVENSPMEEHNDAFTARKGKGTARRGQKQLFCNPVGSQRSITTNRTHSRTDVDSTHFDVQDGCRVLILGDSQAKNLTGLPSYFQVESFRGARYPWITDVAKDLDLPDSVEHIVLATGINDRDSDYDRVVVPTFNTCYDALKQTGRKIHFLGIDIPTSFSEEQEGAIYDINMLAATRVQKSGYIKETDGRVSTTRDDLHYDSDTLETICDKITSHFSFLN